MAGTGFEQDDLDALRALLRTSYSDEPAARRGNDYAIASVQLNVRVRPQIKADAIELARRNRCTLAELIERAIAALGARGGST
jgi:hypothetical protein